MTSTSSTFRAAPDDDRQRPLQLCDPGALFAAIPALLGYQPHESLIVVSLAGPDGLDVKTIMRHDLVLTTARDDRDVDGSQRLDRLLDMSAALEQYSRRFERDHSSGAVALIVDSAAHHHGHDHRDIIGALTRRLSQSGADLLGAYATTEIASGARWWSLIDRAARGRVDDPRASAVTAAQVFAGRRILDSRSAVEELVRCDPARQSEVLALIEAAADSADLEFSLGVQDDDGRGYRKRKLEQVLRQIGHLADGEPLLAVEVAELGLALVKDRVVRDAVLSLAAGTLSGPAEQLWLLLTRSLPDPHRAEAAALLAFSAFLRGDGTLAAIALTAALSANQGHRLANLLNSALEQGIGRDELVHLAEIGYAGALAVGVRLPPIGGPHGPVVRPV